jgi:MoaA/NifB/PqqE/SkfB family radical SAM enzyme
LRNRIQIGVELTSRCDLACRHCLRTRPVPDVDLDIELFASIASQAAQLGQPHLALTGGEPSLHPGLDALVAITRERELTCHLVTNGHSYARQRGRLDALRPTLTSLSISLDGACEAAHDALRGPGSFKRVCLAVALAVQDGWDVTIQCVVHPHNRHQLEQVIQLGSDLGVANLLFAYLLPTRRARENQLVLDPDEWRCVNEEIRSLAEQAPLPVGVSTGMPDPIPVAHCHTLKHLNYSIDPRGRMTFCCQLSGIAGQQDLVADLATVPLADALDYQLALASQVTRERLRYTRDHPDDPRRDHHCDFCLRRFGKLE